MKQIVMKGFHRGIDTFTQYCHRKRISCQKHRYLLISANSGKCFINENESNGSKTWTLLKSNNKNELRGRHLAGTVWRTRNRNQEQFGKPEPCLDR